MAFLAELVWLEPEHYVQSFITTSFGGKKVFCASMGSGGYFLKFHWWQTIFFSKIFDFMIRHQWSLVLGIKDLV